MLHRVHTNTVVRGKIFFDFFPSRVSIIIIIQSEIPYSWRLFSHSSISSLTLLLYASRSWKTYNQLAKSGRVHLHTLHSVTNKCRTGKSRRFHWPFLWRSNTAASNCTGAACKHTFFRGRPRGLFHSQVDEGSPETICDSSDLNNGMSPWSEIESSQLTAGEWSRSSWWTNRNKD